MQSVPDLLKQHESCRWTNQMPLRTFETERYRQECENAEKEETQIGPNFATACFDLQKVLPCPHKRRHPSSTGANWPSTIWPSLIWKLWYMWSEHVSGRVSNQVATCVFDYIKTVSMKGEDTIYLFSDTGQNRNKAMATMVWHSVRTIQCRTWL